MDSATTRNFVVLGGSYGGWYNGFDATRRLIQVYMLPLFSLRSFLQVIVSFSLSETAILIVSMRLVEMLPQL